MKKITKTRDMLRMLISEKRERKEGYPILDVDVKEVREELESYEYWYGLYKRSTMLLLIILAVIGLRSCR